MIEAISAIDIALWDLAAQRRGEPLHLALGGAHHVRIPCYASSLRIKVPEQAAADAHALVAAGFEAVKLKVGRGPGRVHEDLDAVDAVRAAMPPHVKLMVDANGGYDLATDRTVARHLDYAPHTGQSSAVCLAATLHLATAAPNARWYEFIAADWSATQTNPLRERISDFDFAAIRDGGHVVPPGVPGIGLRMDWEAVRGFVTDT